jgi:magnesium-protoporphyrin O-methyltransferase
MNCCQCQGIETLFNEKYVAGELARYRKKGPLKTTRILIEALKAENVHGLTLLDIGGGVGAIQHELLQAGLRSAIAVEASSAYILASQAEAKRRGNAGRVSYHHGNFVDLASGIAPADIVTLDRVLCCYHDMRRLVGLSAVRARRLYGLVYPRDRWWLRVVLAVENCFFRIGRNPFRAFLHSPAAVEAVLIHSGLKRRFMYQTLVWQVVVYTR